MNLLEYSLLAASSLFVIVDPFAVIPAFIAMTPNDTPSERARMAKIACLVVAGVLLVFGFAGNWIFQFLGITMPAFQIAASIVLLLVALDMLRAQRSRVQETREETAAGAEKTDIAVTPLAIPMLSGPGRDLDGDSAAIGSEDDLAQPRVVRLHRAGGAGELRRFAHGGARGESAEPDCAAHRHARHGAAAGGHRGAVHGERVENARAALV